MNLKQSNEFTKNVSFTCSDRKIKEQIVVGLVDTLLTGKCVFIVEYRWQGQSYFLGKAQDRPFHIFALNLLAEATVFLICILDMLGLYLGRFTNYLGFLQLPRTNLRNPC
jgi:hypothetical protein